MKGGEKIKNLPEPIRTHVIATLGETLDPRGVFVESGDEAMAMYALTDRALVRVQVLRSGQWQRSVIPLPFVSRVEEVFDNNTLTVVIEFDADRVNASFVGAHVEGKFEAQGTFLRNGYVLSRTPPTDALAAFAHAVRESLL